MGVPGFFLWLWKKYKSQNFVFTKDKIPDIDIGYVGAIIYLTDLKIWKIVNEDSTLSDYNVC